jgi:mRNA interferase RelE/StbE
MRAEQCELAGGGPLHLHNGELYFTVKTISYTAAAAEALDRMPVQTAARIEAKMERYAMTGEGDVKALKGLDEYRLRVGDYRIIFTEDLEIVAVVKIGRRDKIYQ